MERAFGMEGDAMQSACAIQTVDEKEVDEVENVDFRLVEWLCNPSEKPLRAVTIVEYPHAKKVHVDWRPYASEADEWTFFARVIDAHEYWLREVRRKNPKELRRSYVAAGAKDRVRVIGACLLELCRKHRFLPLTPAARDCIRRKASSFSKKAQPPVAMSKPVSRTSVWAARRNTPRLDIQELHEWDPLTVDDYQERMDLEASRIPWCTSPQSPQVKHLGLCATFAGLTSEVKPGEKTRVSSCGHYTEAARSNDGNTIVLTSKFGIQKTLIRSITQRDGQVVTTVVAKYSRPVRFTGRDGAVTYSDTEQETIFHLVDDTESAIEYTSGSNAVEGVSDLLQTIAPETTLLTDIEKKRRAERGDQREAPTAPTVPNRIRVKAGEAKHEPNSCVGILTTSAWRSILYHKVRINPREQTFTIEGKTYPIAQFRVSTKAPAITQCVGMRGQLTWPYLTRIAGKVAYLQRASPDRNTFNTILTERLPWLLANIDTAMDESASLPVVQSTPLSR